MDLPPLRSPYVPGLVSLVTLNWCHWRDLTWPFLRGLEQYTPPPYEVIVVDQGSGPMDRLALSEYYEAHPDWFVTRFLPENVGFPAGCNKGADLARGEYLVQINNDIIVQGDWLTPCLGALRQEPRAVVGASLIQRGGWNEYNVGGKEVVIPYLEGWLMAMRRETWQEVGDFDEAFGVGSLEDVEWCGRAVALGHALIALPDLPLVHLRGKTVMDGRLRQLEASRANYEMMKMRIAGELAKEC